MGSFPTFLFNGVYIFIPEHISGLCVYAVDVLLFLPGEVREGGGIPMKRAALLALLAHELMDLILAKVAAVDSVRSLTPTHTTVLDTKFNTSL